jgi:hypothetical protein
MFKKLQFEFQGFQTNEFNDDVMIVGHYHTYYQNSLTSFDYFCC